MTNNTIQIVYSPCGSRRVSIYRRDCGTYGSLAEKFSSAAGENCWIPESRYCESFTDSAERAMAEVFALVDWLAASASGGM